MNPQHTSENIARLAVEMANAMDVEDMIEFVYDRYYEWLEDDPEMFQNSWDAYIEEKE